jgi:RHS repeat-associated protein
VSASGNNLTKTAADGWFNGGAASTQTINSGDGYVEFTATETNTARLCGLNHGDPDQGYGIAFALGAWYGGTLYLFESGNYSVLGSYSAGDQLKVAVESGVVKYYQNGQLIHTSSTPPSYPLLVDTSLYSNGATISNAVISNGSGGGGGGSQNASWTNAVGVSASGNNLAKTAADGWGNGGAASTQTINSGDGYVEFTATETNTARLCGLNHGDPDQSYGIAFALGAWYGGTLYLFEAGSYSVLGSYSAGDRLKVAVESGVVKYYQNGQLIHTSTVAPTYPLLVDTSLYSNGSTLTNVVISGAAGGSGTAGGWRYVLQDLQGSTRAVMNNGTYGSSTVIARHDYLPFGEEIGAGTGQRTSSQGYGATDTNRQKYGLIERDDATGLDHTWWRKYESTAGRWTSPDPLGGRIGDPQTFNHYTYAANDPANLTDPTGLEPPTCMLDGMPISCGIAGLFLGSGAGVLGPLHTTRWNPNSDGMGHGGFDSFRAVGPYVGWFNMHGVFITINAYVNGEFAGSASSFQSFGSFGENPFIDSTDPSAPPRVTLPGGEPINMTPQTGKPGIEVDPNYVNQPRLNPGNPKIPANLSVWQRIGFWIGAGARVLANFGGRITIVVTGPVGKCQINPWEPSCRGDREFH